MLKKLELKDSFIVIALFLSAFLINFYVGSRGVYPVDTFIHFDNGYRILLGENPVKDYWIVHGFLIDYIQAIFFYFFGSNWSAYLIHASLFNSIIVIFTYYIFKSLKIKSYLILILLLGLSILAYPVSGTPFLDLHSAFFSLFSIYFLIIAIINNKNFYWFWAAFFLCIAFFSKQVPAAYVILVVSFINVILAFNKKNLMITTWYFLGAFSFLILLLVFLLYKNIHLNDFIVQIFLFPQSIGTNRYVDYNLGLKNIILDYKLIYVFLLFILSINILNCFKKKDFLKSKSFLIFIIIFTYSVSIIIHQIYTKNQVFIFFLIPILAGFSIYFLKDINFKNKKLIILLLLLVFLFASFKYNNRFNIERKFHELSNVNINNSIKVNLFNDKFKGINWISPYYKNPEDEVEKINKFFNILSNDKQKNGYHRIFFSLLLNEKLHSPSRTYDSISYPKKDTKYFKLYQKHLVELIKKNNIKHLYLFEPKKITQSRLNHLIYDYISESCFQVINISDKIKLLKIINCKELK